MSHNPNQQRVFEFMQQIPSQAADISKLPTVPPLKVRILRARLMMEELMETIHEGLGLDIWVQKDPDEPRSQRTISFQDIHFEEPLLRREPDLNLIADGLADCEVVNMGTAVACGLNMQPIFDLVMDNNTLKLKTGTIDEHGKLVKAKDHPKPDIASEVKRQVNVYAKE